MNDETRESRHPGAKMHRVAFVPGAAGNVPISDDTAAASARIDSSGAGLMPSCYPIC